MYVGKLYAMGFRAAVKRSTLADANESRDWHIWSDLAALLIRRARKLYPGDSLLGVELDNTVYALDSSTIDLCLSLFSWAPFRSTKAAIKLHTLLDLRGTIPAFIHISVGKLHDVNVLDMLVLEVGTFYVMDRGYVDFERLHAMQRAGAFFVTRAKSPMDARRVYSATTDRSTGVISDQQVMLNEHYSAKKYPQHLRCIRFKDPESGKTLIFLTNHMALPALTIAALYKSRWQVELFFDCLSYCTPSYVIEYQGSADPRRELMGLDRPERRGIRRDRPGEWSTAHCGRPAWPRDPSAGLVRSSPAR